MNSNNIIKTIEVINFNSSENAKRTEINSNNKDQHKEVKDYCNSSSNNTNSYCKDEQHHICKFKIFDILDDKIDCLHRSVVNLRLDIRSILREELVRFLFNNNIGGIRRDDYR